MPHDLVADLQQRGLLYQTTSPELADWLAAQPVTGYIGFDPTADSLHVGSLLQVVLLRRLQRAGHRPIALIGGATGMVGDPSGKQGERSLLDADALAHNTRALRAQIAGLLDCEGERGAVLVDNLDWFARMPLLQFLRDVGKHFTVNQMVARDSVKPRLEDPERWISYTEFSYVLLQAYDFLALHDRHECRLQLGGSDQWGNIVSGCDLVRRQRDTVVHGITVPLLTKADGTKFGKSEASNVWLDPARTSAYEFYQFWLNAADADVGRLLRYCSFRTVEEIEGLELEAARQPAARAAQRALAEEMTDLVHGTALRRQAEATSAVLFGGGDWRSLSADQLADALRGSPRTRVDRQRLAGPDGGLVALLAETGLCPSRGQARQAVSSGAVAVNGERITDPQARLSAGDLLAERFVVLRRGKKAYHVLEVES